MDATQKQAFEVAWKKANSTKERIKRAAGALLSAGLAKADGNRMRELDQQYREAVDADAEASDELENAMRAAGLNI